LTALDQNPLINGSYPEFDRVLCDNFQLFQSYDAVTSDMLRVGNGASFLTEFGVCAFTDPTSDDPEFLNTDECESVLNANDKYLVSWAYWDSDFYESTRKVNTKLVSIFSRVYPVVTNGIPQHLEFNTRSKLFTYKFTANAHRPSSETVVFVPDHVYPQGFKISVSEHLKWSFDKEQSLLRIELNDAARAGLQEGKRKGLDQESVVRLSPLDEFL